MPGPPLEMETIPLIGGSVTPVAGGAPLQSTFGGGQQICGTVLGHSPCAARETVHTALSPNDDFIPPFSAVSGERFTCAFWGESVRLRPPAVGHDRQHHGPRDTAPQLRLHCLARRHRPLTGKKHRRPFRLA